MGFQRRKRGREGERSKGKRKSGNRRFSVPKGNDVRESIMTWTRATHGHQPCKRFRRNGGKRTGPGILVVFLTFGIRVNVGFTRRF